LFLIYSFALALIVPESDVTTDDVSIVWESDEFLEMLKDRTI